MLSNCVKRLLLESELPGTVIDLSRLVKLTLADAAVVINIAHAMVGNSFVRSEYEWMYFMFISLLCDVRIGGSADLPGLYRSGFLVQL